MKSQGKDRKFKGIKYKMSEWIPASTIPTAGTKAAKEFEERYGKSGVYQVAHASDLNEIGDNIVHEKIGYSGQSINYRDRTYSIRTPKGTHGVNRYIRDKKLCKKTEVYVRYLETAKKEAKKLETEIHNATEKLHGYRFSWKKASDGQDGYLLSIKDKLHNLTSDELKDIIKISMELAPKVAAREIEEELKEIMNGLKRDVDTDYD